ncbi:GNAT family N-acetyltransferase [Methylovirgula sp. 4M-Z18]|uniref:GNAT family N-acetyltransferase n=1 Tax=Methylovirgula sp. 4M-Z18 TaxID=2293567 RepID=UPI000E2F06A9|nr:GNAT family N-acetyltransferase [Methylovirgula sp. 4M-Z18]RFB78924.1 GNAT family N-acetyltransferase [Methylovirgula sp. 4M-Z18]
MTVSLAPNIVIRAFGAEDDLQAVLDLAHRAFGAIPMTPPSGVLRETLQDFRERLADQVLLIARERDAIVAAVFCVPKPPALYLNRLVVAPEHQRQGLGRAMLEAATREALRQSLTKLSLSVRIALAGNRSFFESYGFRIIGAHTHPGFSEPTSYDMEKSLV